MEPLYFYVYEHVRPDTGQVFYVGKGKGSRASNFGGRSNLHKRIVAKLKNLGLSIEVRMVKTLLTETQALALERELVKKYGRINLGTGTLCNLTNGGDKSVTGFKHSEEAKQKFSERNRYNQQNGGYTKGRKLSDAHKTALRLAKSNKTKEELVNWRKAISDSLVGNTRTKGRKLSEEHKTNISMGLKRFRASLSVEERNNYKRICTDIHIGNKYANKLKNKPKSLEHKAKLVAHLNIHNKTQAMRELLASRRGPDGHFGSKKEERACG